MTADTASARPSGHVPAVARALAVMDLLARERKPMNPTGLAAGRLLTKDGVSPPVGVEVVLVIPRSGCVVVDEVVAVWQSLVPLASPSTGGKALALGAAPAGTLLPVHALLVSAPATPATSVPWP